MPWDNQAPPPDWPCTFLIAIVPNHRYESAIADVLAETNTGGNSITYLEQGVPALGEVRGSSALPCPRCPRHPRPCRALPRPQVSEGLYRYYTFTASTPGVPPPTVYIAKNDFGGRAEM
jgi:hypothetical protein